MLPVTKLKHERLCLEWGWRDLNSHEVLPSTDFKSAASTNSATPPRYGYIAESIFSTETNISHSIDIMY